MSNEKFNSLQLAYEQLKTIDTLDNLEEVFKRDTLASAQDIVNKSEKLYWLYRLAKENPEKLQIAFLLKANILQKRVIDEFGEKAKGEAV